MTGRVILIDRHLLDDVGNEARSSPRGRRNRNFHPADDYPANRLLNAIEPGSYVMPHRHLAPTKDESIIVLRGRLALLTFDDSGRPDRACILGPAEDAVGVDLRHGTWHSVLALESGTVFFEAKSGPYLALTADERAPWAPAEGEAGAADYLAQLLRLLA